ncbi:hypothetical protein HK104_005047 [Borealophlyctis nickersoniae]|nr:hypothetical protein HK104_005047 [Borealophlyctis nickersoniae]
MMGNGKTPVGLPPAAQPSSAPNSPPARQSPKRRQTAPPQTSPPEVPLPPAPQKNINPPRSREVIEQTVIAMLQQQRAEALQKAETAQKRVQELEKELAASKEKSSKDDIGAQQREADIQRLLNEQREEIGQQREEIRMLRDQVENGKNVVSELRKELALREHEMEARENEFAAIRQDLEKRLKAQAEQIEGRDEEIAALDAEKTAGENAIQQLERRLAQYKAAEKTSVSQMNACDGIAPSPEPQQAKSAAVLLEQPINATATFQQLLLGQQHLLEQQHASIAGLAEKGTLERLLTVAMQETNALREASARGDLMLRERDAMIAERDAALQSQRAEIEEAHRRLNEAAQMVGSLTQQKNNAEHRLDRTVAAGKEKAEMAKEKEDALRAAERVAKRSYDSPLRTLVTKTFGSGDIHKLSTDHWVPDREITKCHSNTCETQFGLFKRKHHCRRCGNIFCSQHVANRLKLSLTDHVVNPDGAETRVCDSCYGDAMDEIERRETSSEDSGRSNTAMEIDPIPPVTSMPTTR